MTSLVSLTHNSANFVTSIVKNAESLFRNKPRQSVEKKTNEKFSLKFIFSCLSDINLFPRVFHIPFCGSHTFPFSPINKGTRLGLPVNYICATFTCIPVVT